MAHPPDADFIALQEALAGEYSLDREIGRGGMGIVYLLRLQLGSAGLGSVTASLEAAQQIGQQIAGSLAAQVEVDRLLKPTRPPGAPDGATWKSEEDDSDIPVSGVPVPRA